MASPISYLAANRGNSYYLFWGGMAVGGLRLVRGLWRVLDQNGRKWLIAVTVVIALGLAWLNPIERMGDSGGARVTIFGTITITSTSCDPKQEVRIHPLDANRQRVGKAIPVKVDDDTGYMPNHGCTLSFEMEVPWVYAYDISVTGHGTKWVLREAIEGPRGCHLSVAVGVKGRETRIDVAELIARVRSPGGGRCARFPLARSKCRG